jgi:hypothetical protein
MWRNLFDLLSNKPEKISLDLTDLWAMESFLAHI